MAVNHLDDRYLSWLHAQHLAKKHRNLPGPSAPKERIEFLRRVYALPDEQRKDFLSKEEAILTEGGALSDFKRKSALLRALREEFGLALRRGGLLVSHLTVAILGKNRTLPRWADTVKRLAHS